MWQLWVLAGWLIFSMGVVVARAGKTRTVEYSGGMVITALAINMALLLVGFSIA